MITWLKFKFIQLIFKNVLKDESPSIQGILSPIVNSLYFKNNKINFSLSPEEFYSLIVENPISYDLISNLSLDSEYGLSKKAIEEIRHNISAYIFMNCIIEVFSRKDIAFSKTKKHFESKALSYTHYLAKKENINLDKHTISLVQAFDFLLPVEIDDQGHKGRPNNLSSEYFLYQIHQIIKSDGHKGSLKTLISINLKLKSLDNELFQSTPFSEDAVKQALGRYNKKLSSIKNS